jgi:hypothetical protein
MTNQSYVVDTSESKLWKEVLQRCIAYDVYHLPGYHKLAEEQDDVCARLFVHESESVVIGMPLLFRDLDQVNGIQRKGYLDVTSVYGYPGPITNATEMPRNFSKEFSAALQGYLERTGVVTAFSRLNPLIEQDRLLDNFGEVLDIGPTVSLDLMLSEQAQWNQYRNNHRRDIETAHEKGIVCIHDEEWTYLDAFVDTYYENMRRVEADDYYFFDRSYFTRLRDLLEDHVELFVAFRDEGVIAGALFTVCDSIIQYHLGGTRTQYLKWSPIKLIFEEARRWGAEVDARTLHLGGGIGGKKDSLFHFKAGFSNRIHQFKIWRAVVDQESYQALTENKQAWNEQHGLEVADEDYFPTYRAPTRETD